ncbi:hypothetical protein [Desulfuromusa kysingii]
MKKIILMTMFYMLLLVATASAHTALMSCFDEGDGTITCEGGFSDGSSASGVKFHVAQKGQKILETKMNEYSEVNFKKPEGDYQAVFDAGEGHQVIVDGNDIVE